MAQYDVWALTEGDWVVDVQSDLLEPANTRVVVPLIAPDPAGRTLQRLNPILKVEADRLLLATQLIGAVRRSDLKRKIGSVSDQADAITAALDMLITGF
ncbi:CcdB family protein [Sphingomonas sp.]|uniref:CcdB family protein n=1 Tax=Sphingomonas sp. TaxID=28214 RepID=UPI003B00F671